MNEAPTAHSSRTGNAAISAAPDDDAAGAGSATLETSRRPRLRLVDAPDRDQAEQAPQPGVDMVPDPEQGTSPEAVSPTPWTPLFTAGSLWRRALVWGAVLVGTPLTVLAASSAGAPLPLVAALAWLPVLYVIDLAVLRLPTLFVRAAGVSALAASVAAWAGGDLTLARALGAAGCAAVTFLLFATAYVFLPPGSFGLGDLRLAVVIAYAVATQGYLDVVMALWIIAPLSAVAYALALGWFRAALPYGPALITGAVTVAVWPGLFVPSLV